MGLKYAVNEDFFDSWTDEMAYVLGFMFADGHIGRYDYFRGRYIYFSNTNLDRLVLIKKLLNSEHLITTKYAQYGVKPLYVLRIGSQALFEALIAHGVTPRKSLTMLLPEIPEKYFGSFLLGYFDGDGCVFIEHTKDGRFKALRIIYTSASKIFLEELHLRLQLRGIKSGQIYNHGSTLGTFQLKYSTRDSLRIFLIMYNSPQLIELGMPRKYDIFMRYLSKRGLTKETIPLVLDQKGPVVKREHIALQKQH